MDQATKDALLDRFRSYLEELDEGPDAPALAESEAADLHSIFVEIAALRNETRAQTRLTKEALDQFRGLFDSLRESAAALDRQLEDARAREKGLGRALLQPLLLDILDVRDRLAAAVAAAPPRSAETRVLGAFCRLRDLLGRRPPPDRKADPWREGLAMTLRRLDQMLAARRVAPIAMVGKPFQATLARAVSVIEDETTADGVVLAELRVGYTLEGEVLRPAEVTVARRARATDRRDHGETG